MTPAALASPIVRKEWRYARQEGKCVIPVVGGKGIDFDSLPGWMRRTHFIPPDVPDQWRRFVRILEAPCKATRVPFMVEDLPDVFVRRPRQLDQLVASLLDQTGGEPVAITAALKGAGGYGKSTLARAICHEEAIQNAFDDGILWVTLGVQPGDIQSHLVDLIEVLTSERPGFTTLNAAVTRLGEVIGERRMLIVIDDVWQPAHARPFLQAGLNCARLITTRNRDVLPRNAKPLALEAMEESEAIQLLRFGHPDGEDATFAKLAHRLGEWPLLLKLVNGALHKRVAAGQPLAAALASVNDGLDSRGLTVFDARNPVERSDAVAKTLGVSLEPFTEDERARFFELAIFPEDLEVPLAAVETLWSRTAGLDAFGTEDLCTRLYDQSLLLGLDLATRRIRLHDVIRTYLQGVQKERLPALHLELVEAYRGGCSDGWHSGPNDGYYLQFFPRHLRAAGRPEALQELLFDYRWLRAKLKAVGLAALIQDFEQLGTDQQAQKMAAGLRLSAPALAVDPRQLAGQLLGRFAASDGTEIARLLIDTREGAERPTLLPLRATLSPPGTALIRPFSGHSGPVVALAVLPERGQALSAGDDGTVRLWDLGSGEERQRFAGHRSVVFSYPVGRERVTGRTSLVWSVAALPERGQALSAGADGTVRLWDLDSGREVRRFEGHSGGACAVVALPGGQALTAGPDGTMRLWDLDSGREVRRFAGHSTGVRAVAALSERGQVLSVGPDGTVRLWDLASGREVQRLVGHSGALVAVAALPERGQALSAGADGTARLWDLIRGRELQRFVGHNSCVRAVAALRERSQVLSAGDDGTVRLWDLNSGEEMRRFKGHDGWVWAVAASPERGQALSAGNDGTIRLWDLNSGQDVPPFEGHSGAIGAVVALPRRQALSAGDDGTVRLWDLNSGQEVQRFAGHSSRVRAVAALPERSQVLSAGEDGTVRLWDLNSGEEIRRFEGHATEVWAVAASPERGQALSAGNDGTIRLWDLNSGQELRRLAGHSGDVWSVAALPKRGQALSAGADGTVRLWDLDSGREVRRFEGHSHGVWSVAALPGRCQVLSAGADRTVRLWDLNSGQEIRRFEGHSRVVWSVAALPERGQVISAAKDGTVRLWDLASGRQLAAFTGDAPLYCCAVIPDGGFAAAGDGVGQIHVLEILL
jgi:WD40 repeat protein